MPDEAGQAESGYASVNALQEALATSVFSYAADKYKAAGRALGTLVELTTFYTLCAWGLRNHTMTERSVPEFGNPEITHNVEFSLHPQQQCHRLRVSPVQKPLTGNKIFRADSRIQHTRYIVSQLLDSRNIMRNACVIGVTEGGHVVAHIDDLTSDGCEITMAELLDKPFAIFECKRVGVEQGMKKEPQTIEKAKQGAYVARVVSSLQKVRLRNGTYSGILERANNEFYVRGYDDLLREIVEGDAPDLLSSFILTVGVVSNHGNWFTAGTQNKELRVLAQSYDWLLFLTDRGLAQFIHKLILHPTDELSPARDAFLASYTGQSGSNQFTKVRIEAGADKALRAYFSEHEHDIESWYNVIAPRGQTITALREDLRRAQMRMKSTIPRL